MFENTPLKIGMIGLAVVGTALAIAFFFTPGQQRGKASPNRQELRLYVFHCGSILVKDPEPFSPGNALQGPLQLVNTCYLIQHPNGLLMWDTGLSDTLFKQPEDRNNYLLEVKKTLLGQLRDIGINPGQIDFIAFSHLHFDHVGNASAFKNAHWLIQETEYAAAFSQLGKQQGFNPSYYAALRDHSKTLLRGDHDVFGDGRVKIIHAPGHTIGHQLLWIELKNNGPILLSGDLYHFAKNRELGAYPRFNYSARQTQASINTIEKLLRNTGTRLFIQHDAQQNADIQHAPAWLD